MRATIKYLFGKRDAEGEHALVLLLRVLCEQTPPADARHQELANLADELEREFELHPPQLEAPETFAQKFAHFFTGDTEAQRAYRHRTTIIGLVYKFWIKGLLEHSLYSLAMLELDKTYYPETVERR